MSLFIVSDDPELAAHLAIALHRHLDALDRSGRACPPGLAELEQLALAMVRKGQERSRADSGSRGEWAGVYGRDDDPEAFTVKEAAHVAGVSPRTIRRLIASGELPSFTIGSARRIRRRDLAAYLEEPPRA